MSYDRVKIEDISTKTGTLSETVKENLKPLPAPFDKPDECPAL